MNNNFVNSVKHLVGVGILLSLFASQQSFASEYDLFPSNNSGVNLLLMQQASSAMATSTETATSAAPATYKTRWFTANKFHQYLGLGSLALATLTAIVPKPSEDDPESGAHHSLANGAAYLGGAAVASGLVFHYKDLSWKNFSKNPDNWHAILGTLGALGYFAAVSDAPDSAHASYGIVGAVSMLAAIKITW